MKKAFFSLLALIELALLYWMCHRYFQIENRILLVQGQFAYRYADQHEDWVRFFGGLGLLTFAFPYTLYMLWRSFKRR